MNASLPLAITALGLVGSATSPDMSSASLAGIYAFRRRGEHVIEPVAHLMTITPDSRTESIRVTVDAGREQALALMKEGTSLLLASSRFTWQPQVNADMLTDAEKAQTFDCARRGSTNVKLASSNVRPAVPQCPALLSSRSYGRG